MPKKILLLLLTVSLCGTPSAHAAISQGSAITASDIDGLRLRLEALKAAHVCIGAYDWTEFSASGLPNGTVASGNPIRAIHLSRLRRNVNTAWRGLNMSGGANYFINENVTAGTRVLWQDFQQVVDALDAMEAGGVACPGAVNYYCDSSTTCVSTNGGCPPGATCYPTQALCLANAAANCSACLPDGATCGGDYFAALIAASASSSFSKIDRCLLIRMISKILTMNGLMLLR